MKIIHKDLKHGEIKLMPETLDDIWHLYNIIDKGDLVQAITFRTEEVKDDKIRSKKSVKKKMKLGIRVGEIKFHEFSDRLRVHGIIEEGPQELGSYHTLNITSKNRDKITIIKQDWKKHHLSRIDDAVKNSGQVILTFISLDDDNASIAILRQSGLQFIAEIDSKRSGKMYETQYKDREYYGDILSIIRNLKNHDSPIVIVGPGFARDHFVKYCREKDPVLFNKYIVFGTGNAGINGIQEAIKSGVVEKIAKDNRVVFETALVEKFFEEIKKTGLATYGEKEVKNALLNGAVKRLLIIDKFVRTKNGENLLKISYDTNSEFTIINTMHEAGKKFEGIGGIGAILRFKI
jgi:protein pelota